MSALTEPMKIRFLPSFRGAPRYTGGFVGLPAGEVPAILSHSEPVISRREMAAGSERKNISVTFTLPGARDAASLSKFAKEQLQRLRRSTSDE